MHQEDENTKDFMEIFPMIEASLAQDEEEEAAMAGWLQQIENPTDEHQGPTLTFPLVEEEVRKLVETYVIDPDTPMYDASLVELLDEGTKMFQNLPRLIEIETNGHGHKKLVIVGDLHGQLADLVTIFMEHGYPQPGGTQYLFNGDFVDRGEHGVEITTILVAFKLLHPHSVHLNRGNHEGVQCNISYGFTDEVREKYGNSNFYKAFSNLWQNLPIATVVDNRVFVVHGGLVGQMDVRLSDLHNLPRAEGNLCSPKPEYKLLGQALWNDPSPYPGLQTGQRGTGSLKFGPDVTAAFLHNNGLELVIRSHEVPESGHGYEVMHNGKLITVFSASNYCGSSGNYAGLIIFTAPGERTEMEFWAESLDVLRNDIVGCGAMPHKDSFKKKPDTAAGDLEAEQARVQQQVYDGLKDLIAKHSSALETAFEARGQGCWLTPVTIAGVLRLTIPVNGIDWGEHMSVLLDQLQHPATGLAHWQQFLDTFRVKVVGDGGSWAHGLKISIHNKLLAKDRKVVDYIQMFDKDGDGDVSVEELQTCLAELDLQFPTAHLHAFVKNYLVDGRVNVIKFLEGLSMKYRGPPLPPDVFEMVDTVSRFFAQAQQPVEQGKKSSANLYHFKMMDKNKDGMLQYEEFAEFIAWFTSRNQDCAHLNSPLLIRKVFACLDVSGEGTISYMEFLTFFKTTDTVSAALEHIIRVVVKALFKHRGTLKYVFYKLDLDGNGMLSREEFREGLRILERLSLSELSDTDLHMVADYIDTDGDGKISVNEFLSAFHVSGQFQEGALTPGSCEP